MNRQEHDRAAIVRELKQLVADKPFTVGSLGRALAKRHKPLVVVLERLEWLLEDLVSSGQLTHDGTTTEYSIDLRKPAAERLTITNGIQLYRFV